MLKNKYVMFAPLGLLSLTAIAGAFLMSSYSYATDDSTVDMFLLMYQSHALCLVLA